MNTDGHEFFAVHWIHGRNRCLADVGHVSEEFVDSMLFWSRKNWKGLRLLGGSSRFAQAQTTSCGSLKSMVCLFRRLRRLFVKHKFTLWVILLTKDVEILDVLEFLEILEMIRIQQIQLFQKIQSTQSHVSCQSHASCICFKLSALSL